MDYVGCFHISATSIEYFSSCLEIDLSIMHSNFFHFFITDGKGLEIWSPTDQTVKLVSKLLPTETEKSLGLNHASLVPIEGGTELLLYGGYQGEYQSDIWKYIEKSSTWVKEGVLQLAREEQVVLAVEDVQCKPLDENRSLF